MFGKSLPLDIVCRWVLFSVGVDVAYCIFHTVSVLHISRCATFGTSAFARRLIWLPRLMRLTLVTAPSFVVLPVT